MHGGINEHKTVTDIADFDKLGASTLVIWHHSLIPSLSGPDVPTGESVLGLCSCAVVTIN